MIVAGDIGGTKTLLGLYTSLQDVKRPFRQQTFPSQKYDSLEAVIGEFLAENNEPLAAASFAVAGPVKQGVAEITNLPWIIEAENISRVFDIPAVHLMNDVEATAAAVPFLETEDLAILNPGNPDPTGTMVVIAPGTGLGEAFLTWDGQRYRVHPSEGGHASFSPSTREEVDLLLYLYRRFGHLSFERVGSGSGIPNIYEFLRDSGHYTEPAWLGEALAAAHDRTPIIVSNALKARAEICVATLDMFVSVLGSEAGNMALNLLTTGGIYLGGGMPPRILSRLQQPDFLASVTHKGRFQALLDEIPVYVILDSEVTLHGAAYDGLVQFVAANQKT